MKAFYRIIAFFIPLLLAATGVFAAGQDIVFEASSQMMVSSDESFRVEFTINAKPDRGSFTPPSFDGFDVVAGPVESNATSVEFINGNMTKKVSRTYTYVLMPRAAGTFTIGAASVVCDKTEYRSNTLAIEVVDAAAASERRRDNASSDNVGKGVAKDDILMRLTLSRTEVFKGEPIKAVFKIYSRASIVGYDGIKFPSFNGFWAHELDTENAQWQRETLNGKVYDALVVREYLLYPQQAGTLAIEPAEITAIAQVVVQNNRNFDPFFGGHEVYEVRHKAQSDRVNIRVKALPAGAPESFAGAVGQFTMDARQPESDVTANSAVTYTVRISGTGNLTFVQAPKLMLPSSFEQYSVKTTESVRQQGQGMSGYRQFEYPFIARASGEFDIPAVEFTYFDPQTVSYRTLASKPMTIDVASDGTAGTPVVTTLSKEEIQVIGRDIRFIKLGKAGLRESGNASFMYRAYYVAMAAVALLFAMIYAVLRKRIRDRRNTVLIRGRRANKIAVKRFKAAEKFMNARDKQSFYDEMLHALWGYMSDKFNIPVANLTKENVREELHKRGISEQESRRFSDIISKCDEAQYSPAASAQMHEVYAEGVNLISMIESVIKR